MTPLGHCCGYGGKKRIALQSAVQSKAEEFALDLGGNVTEIKGTSPTTSSPWVVRHAPEVPLALLLLHAAFLVDGPAVDGPMFAYVLDSDLPESPTPPAFLVGDPRGLPMFALVNRHFDSYDASVDVLCCIASHAKRASCRGLLESSEANHRVESEGSDGGVLRPNGCSLGLALNLHMEHEV